MSLFWKLILSKSSFSVEHEFLKNFQDELELHNFFFFLV